jgi:hypothetical protein
MNRLQQLTVKQVRNRTAKPAPRAKRNPQVFEEAKTEMRITRWGNAPQENKRTQPHPSLYVHSAQHSGEFDCFCHSRFKSETVYLAAKNIAFKTLLIK